MEYQYQEKSGINWNTWLVLFFSLIILIISIGFISIGMGFFSPTNIVKEPSLNLKASAYQILKARNVCKDQGAIIMRIIEIGPIPIKEIPSVVDIHYKCPGDPEEKASIWDPSMSVLPSEE